MPFEHTLPAGLVARNPDEAPLEEGFEAQWRDDEDPPHYFFLAQVSAVRLPRLVAEALRLLPPRVHAVLEVRRSDEEMDADPDGPAQDRWASPVVSLDAVLRAWDRHGAALVHDGMAGFGAWDPASSLEVFLDDHKLLHLFAPALDPFEALLRRHRVPEGHGFPTILDREHDHLSIAAIRERDPASRRIWTRRRGHDITWFAPAIRKSLRMRRQASPAADGG